MCGIVGYVGPNDTVEALITGLRRLEYRGYDSAGIAVVDEAGQRFPVTVTAAARGESVIEGVPAGTKVRVPGQAQR